MTEFTTQCDRKNEIIHDLRKKAETDQDRKLLIEAATAIQFWYNQYWEMRQDYIEKDS